MQTAIAKKLESLRTEGGIRSVDLARFLNTTPETVSRWNRGRTTPRGDAERRILTLESIVRRLREFYSDPDDARLWLFSPQKLLDGKRPADLIEAGRSDDVLAFLDELGAGVYS